MTPAPVTGRSLYHALRRAGVVLTANGDRLAYDCPAGAMTPDLRALVAAHKAELLALLRAVGGQGFDGGDVQKGNEGGAVGQAALAAQPDVQAVADRPSHLGVADFVAFPAAGDDAERVERAALQKFKHVVKRHAHDPTPPDYWPQRLAELLADLQERFDERAGICEFSGGMSRGEAERTAYEEVAEAAERGGRGPAGR